MSVLTLKFTNESQLPDSEVYFGFVPGSTTDSFEISYIPDVLAPVQEAVKPLNTAKGPGNWYRYDQLKNGVEITHFSGRIYVSYGQTWEVLDAYYEPAQNVTDANFFLRYDKMELTFNGKTTDVADLTSIDYWSIPMKLETSIDGIPVASDQGIKNGVDSLDIYKALRNLTLNTPSGLAQAKPALVPGSFQQHKDQKGKGFARIIGPSSYPALNGIPEIPYHVFDSYLAFLYEHFGGEQALPISGVTIPGLGNGVMAFIKGHFAGVGPNVPPTGPQSAQEYDLKATITKETAGYVVSLSGTVGSDSVKMVFTQAELTNPAGIYGANAQFTLEVNGVSKGTIAPANDVYGWVSGDLLAGFNIGALGSIVQISNEYVGAMKSSDWFQKIPNTELFGALQSNAAFYNQYAAALQSKSDAYNFAYSDRFDAVQISLNPEKVNTLELTVMNVTTEG